MSKSAKVVLIALMGQVSTALKWLAGRSFLASIFLALNFLALVVLLILSPQIMLVVASKHRLKTTSVVILTLVFFFITMFPLAIRTTDEERDNPLYAVLYYVILSGVTAAMLAIAP